VNLVLRPAAVADMRAAQVHTRKARPGSGEDLAEDLDRLFERLKAFPRSAQVVAGYQPGPACSAARVSYVVFCRSVARRIDVLRIVHTGRSPGNEDVRGRPA
jgi:plasmid stabilization system protein ParE